MIYFRGEVNKQISQLPQYFPNSISPFDMAIAETRKQVSQMGYDPYRLKDYTQSVGMFTVTSSHTWITGLASFYRMGNITITMENRNVRTILEETSIIFNYAVSISSIKKFQMKQAANKRRS